MNHATIMTALMTIVDELTSKSDVATNVYPGDDVRRFAPVDIHTDEIGADSDTQLDVMVPPLQQKLELLKKSVGVDNVFDTEDECGCDDNGDYVDELDLIRKNAGVITPNVTAIMSLADDEPLD